MTFDRLNRADSAAEFIDELRKTLKDQLDAYEEISDMARRKIAGEIDHVLACLDILDKKTKDSANPLTKRRISRLNKLIVKPVKSGRYKNRFRRLSDIERNLSKIEKQIIEMLGDTRG